jgi:hypothetical protein
MTERDRYSGDHAAHLKPKPTGRSISNTLQQTPFRNVHKIIPEDRPSHNRITFPLTPGRKLAPQSSPSR